MKPSRLRPGFFIERKPGGHIGDARANYEERRTRSGEILTAAVPKGYFSKENNQFGKERQLFDLYLWKITTCQRREDNHLTKRRKPPGDAPGTRSAACNGYDAGIVNLYLTDSSKPVLICPAGQKTRGSV